MSCLPCGLSPVFVLHLDISSCLMCECLIVELHKGNSDAIMKELFDHALGKLQDLCAYDPTQSISQNKLEGS